MQDRVLPEPARALRRDTLAVRVEHGRRGADAPCVAPLVQSVTFAQPRVGSAQPHTYSRASNPTVEGFEQALARLEGLPWCSAYASGMAAISALCLSELSPGDHVLCGRVVYGGTQRLLREVLRRFHVACDFVDTRDVAAVAARLTERTKLLLVESPANPTLELCDLAALGALCRERELLFAVDNTFLTAALQRPAELGADVVIYSTTKYVDGHNLAVGGALLTADEDLHQRLLRLRKTVGSIQAPFGAWITVRGLQTLPLRMARHSESALRVARWLSTRAEVRAVHYPFLESHPQHALARRQQAAGGGVVSFELAGGAEQGRAFLDALRLCTRAESLGAAETLVTHPATMTHGDVPREERIAAGIGDGLVRLSVGLEDVADLIEDLAQALVRAAAPAEVRS